VFSPPVDWSTVISTPTFRTQPPLHLITCISWSPVISFWKNRYYMTDSTDHYTSTKLTWRPISSVNNLDAHPDSYPPHRKEDSSPRIMNEACKETRKMTLWEKIYKKYEFPRKFLHVSVGFLTLYLDYIGMRPSQITPLLIAIFIPVFFADLIRFKSRRFNRLYQHVLGFLMRDDEKLGWNGTLSYIIGLWTVLSFFPRDIAIVSILLLSWCDTAASTLGRKFGRNGPFLRKGKSLVGSLSAVVIGCAAAYLYWVIIAVDESTTWNRFQSHLSVVQLCSITGLIAGISEAVDIYKLDDNVVLPIVSASLLWLILDVCGLGK
ncbi:CTP-dependent diacylglycerol kinase 1, partial [Neolecta irregularis DAH-3]